jgi:restriction system protein
MKFEMNDKSLFAILLRSQWWVSAAIVVTIVVLARFLLPPAWFVYGAFGAIPFAVIAGMTAWKQLQAPSAGRVVDTVAAVRTMSWADFADAMEAGFKREGYEVKRDTKAPVDFEMTKEYRTTLVACKRWKAARVGVEPLRELLDAREAREAHFMVYVTTGQVSEQALAFAKQHRIRLVTDMELAKLVPPSAFKAKTA